MKKQKKHSRLGILFLYGCFVELFCGTLAYMATSQFGVLDKAIALIRSFATPLSSIFGLFFGCVFAAWLVLFQFSDEFGAWLEWRGVRGLISTAFLLHLSVFVVATLFTYIINTKSNPAFSRATYFVVCIGTLNMLSSMLLIHNLIKLQSVFKYERKKTNPYTE